MAAWVWAMLSAFVLLHLLQKLFNSKRKTKKRNMPPGPRGLPILGHLHLLGKSPHRALHDLARKHGPIMGMRFGFVPTVVVSSPEAAELVLRTHDVTFAGRPSQDAFHYISYGQKNLAFSPYGPYWREMRKLCTVELLSTAKINQFLPMREAEIRLLVGRLREAGERGEAVDLTTMLLSLVRDMNCLMLFGRKFGDDAGSLDDREFKEVILEASELGAQFNIADYFPCVGVFDVQGINRKMKGLAKIFDRFLEKIIDEHVQNRNRNRNKNQQQRGDDAAEDFVDTMMGILESGRATFKFDRSHVKAILLDMLIAGTDSSATVADWALAELIKHPEAMRKLQKELEAAVGMGSMVEQRHLERLEYLDQVVKETLRLHTIAPLMLPHESLEDCDLKGFHIPRKTRIMINIWAIMRDPSVWPDPESFVPERFAGGGKRMDVTGQHFELIPFGAGRRSCPGRQVGLTAVKLILSQLVHCFDWELPNGMKHADMDMAELFGIVTGRIEHLNVKPVYRLLSQ
ncbi:cytochrome P450 71AU50-like [Andrographis paniculata]|uniref:cytochrome P450 71AU50-like n=1 Tax=Andrographis paniculata TaxID=175694 RepID=UPI0021E79BB9|nr:cytochrome P450 71AU50-like [Andrographis paniculata]